MVSFVANLLYTPKHMIVSVSKRKTDDRSIKIRKKIVKPFIIAIALAHQYRNIDYLPGQYSYFFILSEATP